MNNTNSMTFNLALELVTWHYLHLAVASGSKLQFVTLELQLVVYILRLWNCFTGCYFLNTDSDWCTCARVF